MAETLAPAKKKRGRPPKQAAADDAAKSQQAFAGTFTPEDERLENLVIEFEKSKANVQKATDKKTAAYDALKAELREQGIDSYHCYKTRKKVLMAPEDAKVKVVDIKGDEPTPYHA